MNQKYFVWGLTQWDKQRHDRAMYSHFNTRAILLLERKLQSHCLGTKRYRQRSQE